MKRLDSGVLDVLARCDVSGDKVYLPGQLDRKTYLAVNSALDSIGGKWSRQDKAHVFPHPIDVEFAEMLTTGIMPKRNELSFFATPLAVGERLVGLMASVAGDWASGVVLEPSAGEGHLVRAIVGAGVVAESIEALEVDAFRWGKLTGLLPHAKQADFLAYKPEGRFSAVICNPPFNTPGLANAWVDHINHALCVAPVVAAVVPRSIEFANGKVGVLRDRCAVVVRLQDDAFARSGAMVKTNLVVVNGGRQ